MSKKKDALDLINRLVKKFGKGGYIFRGTTTEHSKDTKDGKIFDGINSTLYRWVVIEPKKGGIAKEKKNLREIFAKNENFFPSDMEMEIVENADSLFAKNTKKQNILTDLQHFGGKTNMIDFSHSIYVALFFACQRKFRKSGELIILREKNFAKINKINYGKRPKKGTLEIINPTNTQVSQQRVLTQKSVFVRPADGYINRKLCRHIEEIPANIKKHIMDYLRTPEHKITENAIYNDLHGFINNEKNNETASLYFYMGRACHTKSEYGNAIKYYNKSIGLNPHKPQTYNNRALVYCDMGEYQRAIEGFNKAISLNPNLAEAYTNRGSVYSDLGQHENAIKDHNKAISLNPNFAGAYTNRGCVYSDLGQHENAIKDHDKAISLNPNLAAAYSNRGGVYNSMGQHERAIEDHDKAISLDPNLAEAYNNRGCAYDSMGQHKRAIKDHNKAISLNPNLAAAYSYRGCAYNNTGQHERAIKDHNKAISLNPNLAEVYFNRGLTYISLRKNEHAIDNAIDDFSKAISLKRDFADAYNHRGKAYLIRGNAYYNRGISIYLQQLNLAIDDLSQFISLKPNSAEGYFNRGNTHYNLGVAYHNNRIIAVNYKPELNLAIDDFNKAILLKPDYADAYYGRGMAKTKSGNIAGGFADMERAKRMGYTPPQQE